jgi:hypothetical protein
MACLLSDGFGCDFLYFLGLRLPISPTAAHTTQARGSRKTPTALAHKAGLQAEWIYSMKITFVNRQLNC